MSSAHKRRLRHSGPANLMRWALNFRGQRRVVARQYVFAALGRLTPSIAVDADGLRLYVSTADQVVSRALFAEGVYDRRLFTRVARELERVSGSPDPLQGRCFLDIGANIGTATCVALNSYGVSRAWAFEPAPQNHQLLRQNLIANGFEDRVSIHQCALSDRDGSVAFELSETNWGDHRVRGLEGRDPPALMGEKPRKTIEVVARRLDSLIEEGTVNLENVGLAWIDAQSHEAHILDGAAALLRTEVPIVCEYWPYGLSQAGTFDRFHDLVASERSSFIDLSRRDPKIRPTGSLRTLAQDYEGAAFTDLLLWSQLS